VALLVKCPSFARKKKISPTIASAREGMLVKHYKRWSSMLGKLAGHKTGSTVELLVKCSSNATRQRLIRKRLIKVCNDCQAACVRNSAYIDYILCV
jgi:hypothetical protein